MARGRWGGSDLVGGGERKREKEKEEEAAMRGDDHEHMARRNSKCLGYTAREVTRPAVRRVDRG